MTVPRAEWVSENWAQNYLSWHTGADWNDVFDSLREALTAGKIRAQIMRHGAAPESLQSSYWLDDDKVIADSNARNQITLNYQDFMGWLNSPAPDRIGRPPKWDWERFWIEVVSLANTPDGLPDRQAELEERMAAWFGKENDGNSPAESLIRAKLSKLYQRINRRA